MKILFTKWDRLVNFAQATCKIRMPTKNISNEDSAVNYIVYKIFEYIEVVQW